MAQDGVIFRFLANIHPRFQTPFIATIMSGMITGVLAMMLDLKSLVDMMSIGTLMAYMIVSVCVLLLHHKVGDPTDAESAEYTERDTNTLLEIRDDLDGVMTKLFNLRGLKNPTVKTE